MKFYGLKNCDTCRKAMKELRDGGIVFSYHDVRVDGLSEAVLVRWLEHLAPAILVNRRSTTWRSLSDADKTRAETAQSAAQLLAEHPTLLKRPVIEDEDQVLVGWQPQTRQHLLAR